MDRKDRLIDQTAHNSYTYHVFGATNFGRVKDTRVNSKYYSNPET